MDESWRIRMTAPSVVTRRRASSDSISRPSLPADISFQDVFGGPPRSVLSKKLSCDFSSYDYFYREIFRRQEHDAERRTIRRSKLPDFAVPLSRTDEDKAVFKPSGNYNHYEDHVLREKKPSSSSRVWRSLSKPNWISKSKSKSKSNSSEEISPLPIQPGAGDEDDVLDSFASRLRPINVPSRWNNQTSEAPFHCTNPSYIADNFIRCSNPCFSQQFPSPEAGISHSLTVGISVDDIEHQLESPSSAKSVFCNASEEDEDELESSYVIEINSGTRGVTNEDADIDEAIAWAKGKFHGCRIQNTCQFGQEKSMVPLVMEEGLHNSSMQKENEKDLTGELLETVELDERINSWSIGKETNVRWLLSTLHHVLWDNSGWNAIPFSNLVEHSQVKKAYQKARLCIHPDKLQQRSATTQQKYIAQKMFSVLQNAWDSFISQEVVSC